MDQLCHSFAGLSFRHLGRKGIMFAVFGDHNHPLVIVRAEDAKQFAADATCNGKSFIRYAFTNEVAMMRLLGLIKLFYPTTLDRSKAKKILQQLDNYCMEMLDVVEV